MDKRVDCHVSTCMSDNKPNLMSPMLTFYSTWKCSINKNVTRSCPKLRQHLWGLNFLLHNGRHMDVYPYSLHLWLIFLPTSTYWPCSSFGVKSKELSIVVGVWWHLQIHTFREWNLVFSVRHELVDTKSLALVRSLRGWCGLGTCSRALYGYKIFEHNFNFMYKW